MSQFQSEQGWDQMAKSDAIRASQLWLSLAAFLFFVACLLPVFETTTPEDGFEGQCRGWEALLLGWAGVLGGCFAWFANPLMVTVAVLLFFDKWHKALLAANSAVLCAFTTFFHHQPLRTGNGFENVLCIGAWFWFAAIACVWRAAYVCSRNTQVSVADHSAVVAPACENPCSQDK